MQTTYPQSKGTRLASIDGWRGVAIILVLLAHSRYAKDPIPLSPWLATAAGQGLGVRIFFVISGFLITYLLIKEWNASHRIGVANFYRKRAIRLFPVYFLFLAVLALMQVFSLYSDELSTWIGALTFTRNILGRGSSATEHLWSLAAQEQFYLLWPVIVVGLGLAERWRLALALLAITVVVAICARVVPCTWDNFVCTRILAPHSLVRFVDSLAIGCMGAIVYIRLNLKISSAVAAAVMYSSALALAMSAIFIPAEMQYSVWPTLQAFLIITSLLFSMHAQGTLLYNVLNSREAVYLGTISYSIYIWHVLFLSMYIGLDLPVSPLYDGPLWWAGAILLASASYFWFERPVMALTGKLPAIAPFRAPLRTHHAI